MKLIYSLSPSVAPSQREELTRLVSESLSGATVSLDEAGARLVVLVADTVGAGAVFNALHLRLLSFGIELKELYREMPAATVSAGGPDPVLAGYGTQKQRRTVPLSTFLVSLIAAVLSFSIISFVMGSGCALLISGGDTLGTTGEEEAEDYAGKIALIDEIFKQYSLYDADGQLLLDEMLKAYAVATGDDYAAYYTEEEFAALLEENSGNAVGVGVTVTESTDPVGILIIDVLPDSPAMAAGVLPGDVVISLGSGEQTVFVSEKGFEASLELLRGEAGTKAEFTVVRDGEEHFFSVTRTAIKTVSASGRVSETDPAVGIVRITQFDLSTPVQFKAAMDELISKNCTKFVIDVRNNPGGDLRSVKAVLSFFLNEGALVVSTFGKDGKETSSEYVEAVTYEDEGADCSVSKEDIGRYRQYPLAVLMNGYSASAAELFASTLRDYELATLVGETSFGKGIIQSVFDLSVMGYSGGFKLTVGYYTPPSGENYHDKGIAPHVEVALTGEAAEKNFYLLTEAEDNQLQAALQALKP
ncbi:MAG: PDZ domain-containing protein [Ruminococcaceae bacterium]|nr:PDZ domain-containing protein [Oscillospiraceae bacterium]